MKNLFTPRINKDSDERIRMDLSDDDIQKVKRGKFWNATITDINTDKIYDVEGARCSLDGCFCDAVIV